MTVVDVEVEELVRRMDEAVDARVLLAALNASDAGALVTEEDRKAADLKVRESMAAISLFPDTPVRLLGMCAHKKF